MAEPILAEEDGVLRDLAHAYTRHRKLLFAIAVGFLLIGFNGQWIVERDTSMYRGLGHTLATGQGYSFGEFASSVIYPGLPLILAGLELAFGDTALPAILLMNLIALATLVMTYRLVRLHFPEWIAVAVTVGVGLNARFVQVAQEIMTDLPFLLGVVLFLYGWERLRLALAPVVATPASSPPVPLQQATQASQGQENRKLLAPVAYLLLGLVIALSMRPTFWILAMAWGLVCVWGVIRGPRKLHATCLLLVFLAGVVFFYFDPRTRGFNPLGGGYESHFLEKLTRVRATVGRNLPEFFSRQFSEGFFNGRFGFGITHAITAALIGSTYFLFRRGLVLWGLLILCTIVVTVLIEVVPRYYLMILPVMMVAYVLLWRALAIRAGPRWGPAVFTAGVVLFVVPNIVRGTKFIYEQHWKDPGRRIEWERAIVSAEMIKENVPEGSAALAPGATIVSYLSGRDVYMAREIFPENEDMANYPRYLAAKGVEYAIWPPNKIRDHEGLIAEMMDRGVIVPTEVVMREMGLTLAKIKVVVPPDGVDWRDNPVREYDWVTTTQRRPTSEQIRHQQRLKREAYEARVRREKNELKAKLEARRKREAKAARESREVRERIELRRRYEQRLAREARERQAANARRLKRLRQQAATQATQPATQPATAPAASQPVSMHPRSPFEECSDNHQRLSLLRWAVLEPPWAAAPALRDDPRCRSMARFITMPASRAARDTRDSEK
ncbi:MAG TPA: hypothetical protein VGR35_16180 [Tepidisphaeraceae bacterium]|nr:hypothetical protein [Tepidisphaeraceae bacterium]